MDKNNIKFTGVDSYDLDDNYGSHHKINKRVYEVFLTKNGNDYDFTLTLSLTGVELGHITACIEYIYPTDSNIQTRVTGTNVFVGAATTSENTKQKFVRLITQMDNNVRESNNAFSVNFKGASTDSKSTTWGDRKNRKTD